MKEYKKQMQNHKLFHYSTQQAEKQKKKDFFNRKVQGEQKTKVTIYTINSPLSLFHSFCWQSEDIQDKTEKIGILSPPGLPWWPLAQDVCSEQVKIGKLHKLREHMDMMRRRKEREREITLHDSNKCQQEEN